MALTGSTNSPPAACKRPLQTGPGARVLSALALAAVFVACSADSPTQIVVVVDADTLLRPQIARVSITAVRTSDQRIFDRTTFHPPDTLPVSIALTHVAGALGPIEIDVKAYNAENRILVSRAATTRFEAGHIRVLYLGLYTECRTPCPGTETCGERGCVPREDTGHLLPWTGRIGTLPPYLGTPRPHFEPDGGSGGNAGAAGSGGAGSGYPDAGAAGSGGAGGGYPDAGAAGSGDAGGGYPDAGAAGSGGAGGGYPDAGAAGSGGAGGGYPDAGAAGSGDGGPDGSTCPIEMRRQGIACPVTQSRWTLPISALDMKDDNSDVYMASLDAATSFLVPEFGGARDPGFPWIAVPMNQPVVTALYIVGYGPSPVPFPTDIPIRAHPSRHVIAIQRDSCIVYEGWECAFENLRWRCRAGRGYSLTNYLGPPSNLMGSDPSGIEIYPLLIKKWEVDVGVINHALRVTVARTRNQFIWPATNTDSSDPSSAYPPLGARMRLRPDITIPATLLPATRTILNATRTHGMLVTAHGTNFAIAGESHCDWDPALLAELATIPASWFEFLYDGL